MQLTIMLCVYVNSMHKTHQPHFNFRCLTIKVRKVPLAYINLLYHRISQNDCKGKKREKNVLK